MPLAKPCAAVLACAGLLAGLASAEGGRVLRRIAYAGAADRARTLDFYPAAARDGAPAPLLVWVHSRFWGEPGDARVLDGRFARPLQREGVAVALVRHRPAPEYRHPAHAEDVAAALAYLLRPDAGLEFDRQRVYLGGHGSGAHLAALLALDPRYLEAVGLAPSALAGVMAVSGVYDLDPETGASDEERARYAQAFGRARREASPLGHARADAPSFLVFHAQDDVPGYREAAEQFARALRRAGHADAQAYPVMARNHFSILQMDDSGSGLTMYLLARLGLRPLPPLVAELDRAVRYWQRPALSSEPLFELGARVTSHPVDARFLEEAGKLFVGLRHKRLEWRPERFHAVALEDLLEALGPGAGAGPWLVLTNAQQERSVLRLDAIQRYRPVVVLGVDDTRNLFTVVDVHRALAEYSWRKELPRPPYLARPMGAFLFFLEAPAEPVLPPTLAHFSLHAGSFRRQREDPLAPLRDLEPELLRVLTVDNGCVHCHEFRGVGPRSGHLRAEDGAAQGGFALPLLEYPPAVWRQFVFEPEIPARTIGANMNPVPAAVAPQLYELVERARTMGP